MRQWLYVSDELCGLGFSLGFDNDGFLLLNGSLDDVLGALGLLLGDLLGLHGSSVFLREGQMSDGHVVQDDLEVIGALHKHVSDLLTNYVSLG